MIDIKAVEVAYNRGYDTGINWTEYYRPGGPWVPRKDVTDKKHHRAIREQLVAEYDAWFEGFEKGLLYKKHEI